MQNVNERLSRLERSVRRWRWLTLVCLLLCGTIVIVAADPAPSDGIIRGKKIILDPDENGLYCEVGPTGKGATGFRVKRAADDNVFAAGASARGMVIMGKNEKGEITFVYPKGGPLDR